MTKEELIYQLNAAGIDTSAYSFDEIKDPGFMLFKEDDKWRSFAMDRGRICDEFIFESETVAYRYFLGCLIEFSYVFLKDLYSEEAQKRRNLKD